MKGHDALFSSARTGGKDEWATPRDLVEKLDTHFRFDLDAAATDDNKITTGYAYLGPDHVQPAFHDALADIQGWGAMVEPRTVWCNPPYSLGKEFIAKARREARAGNCTAVLLLPARTCTRYFHGDAWEADEIVFLQGRLHFGGAKDPAPFPSMLLIFDRGPARRRDISAWDWKRQSFAERRVR